jgi:hypothetical protein
MDVSLCLCALEDALARFGRPEIFNTDQSCQFTNAALHRCGDVRGRAYLDGWSGPLRRIANHRALPQGQPLFVYRFAKNRKANLDDDERAQYRRLASLYLAASDAEFGKLVEAELLTKVSCDGR